MTEATYVVLVYIPPLNSRRYATVASISRLVASLTHIRMSALGIRLYHLNKSWHVFIHHNEGALHLPGNYTVKDLELLVSNNDLQLGLCDRLCVVHLVQDEKLSNEGRIRQECDV